MPQVLSYIVYGYVFLTAYYWISFKDDKDLKNLLTKSVAVSFILMSTYDTILERINYSFASETLKTVLFVLISSVLGFVIGAITSHRNFNLLLHKLHIGRTTNTNIWDDVIKSSTWVRAFMKDNSSYLGQYRYGEPFKSEPIIVLATYQKLDADNDIVIDNHNDPNRVIMLNTKDFDKIEIIYTPVKKKSFWDKFKKTDENNEETTDSK